MTTYKRIAVALFFSLFLLPQAKGQSAVDIYGHSSVRSLVHTGDLPPLWSVALQEGRWNNLAGSQTLITADAGIGWSLSSDFKISGKAEIDYATGFKDAFLHKGMGQVQYKNWSLRAGKHTFDPIFPEQNMGSGSYLYGNNYRPISRITFELSEYSKLPLTRGFVEVRGGISHGWLSNQPLNGDVLLLEKYSYLRINLDKWKPYAGLIHSTLFGGQKTNGEKIPVDFWPTFIGKGSEKIGGGEATNAAGAHMGMYDVGTSVDLSGGHINFYYQIPFSDGSGMLFWQGNTDHVLGIDLHCDASSWLNNLTFEWIQTAYQSGNGTPDPYLNGIVFPKDVGDRNAFVSENFGIEPNHPLSLEEFKDILEVEINHGNDFGGRDGYMNNGLYPAGWTREGHIMGSPLNLTRAQLLEARPEMTFNHGVWIKNERFSALHLGGRGRLKDNLSWRMKLTWSRNFGTYFEQYPGRYTWDEDEDYWFKGGRDQWYSMAGILWMPKKLKGFSVRTDLFFDQGEIYGSFGFKTAVVYQVF